MHENLICLPSGMIINMANVAFILPFRESKIRVVFLATFAVSQHGQPMAQDLDLEDSRALLNEIENRRVDCSALREKTGIKS
jgi:hypothetical protein